MRKMYVRPIPEARHALKTLLADVTGPDLLGDCHQEDFIAATWMWMRELDVRDVARGVAPHLKVILESLGEDGVAPAGGVSRPGSSHGEDDDAPAKTRRKGAG
jgi:hypothetical protein